MTRRGVPATVIPSQSAIGTSADQFSGALPASASRDASSASQSDTSPVFVASATTPPTTQPRRPLIAPGRTLIT